MCSNSTGAALFSFSMEKYIFGFVVLPCFGLCESNSFHVRTYV